LASTTPIEITLNDLFGQWKASRTTIDNNAQRWAV
jgi:hypothetical protein